MLIPSSVLQWWMLGDQLWKLESRKWVTTGELVYKSIILFLFYFETEFLCYTAKSESFYKLELSLYPAELGRPLPL